MHDTDDTAAPTNRLRVACGVFGCAGAPGAADVVYHGLHALQHRGQEGCGITTYLDERFINERHPGLVGEHFSNGPLCERLPGQFGIGHVRYSTQGKSVGRNLQPLYADLPGQSGLAIAHNGNLTNARALRELLNDRGSIFTSESDTEVLLHLAAHSDELRIEMRFLDGLRQVEGGYAIVALSANKLMAARDPLGIRPLVLGWMQDTGTPVVASETCALTQVGARFDRDIRPGELFVTDGDSHKSYEITPPRPARTCAFEYLYFARPDSVVDGVQVYSARKTMGRILAAEAAVDADVVVPVPDGGVPAALGYAEAVGVPFELGIIRSHFVGRSFIAKDQSARTRKVHMKHAANAAAVAGKRVVLIDDSIVRGTTSRKIVELMRKAGAREVHFRSASPRITHGDYYGIDLSDPKTLLARTHPTDAEMAAALHADSVGFLSIDGLYQAVCDAPRDPARPQLSDHYFTGEYPTALTDRDAGRADRHHQLSLLEEVD